MRRTLAKRERTVPIADTILLIRSRADVDWANAWALFTVRRLPQNWVIVHAEVDVRDGYTNDMGLVTFPKRVAIWRSLARRGFTRMGP